MHTSTTSSREHRHQVILRIIEDQPVPSQFALREQLASRGIDVNQATLSRDLRELGLVKARGGYVLPSGALPPTDPDAALRQAVREWLHEVAVALNQLVLRTPPAGAGPLARALDHSDIKHVLGTIAGDDTILVVCSDARAARRLAARLRSWVPAREQA